MNFKKIKRLDAVGVEIEVKGKKMQLLRSVISEEQKKQNDVVDEAINIFYLYTQNHEASLMVAWNKKPGDYLTQEGEGKPYFFKADKTSFTLGKLSLLWMMEKTNKSPETN